MIKPISIEPVLNGYVVAVGCQRVVFTSQESLVSELSKYLRNPEAVEIEYVKAAINYDRRTLGTPPPFSPPITEATGGQAFPVDPAPRTESQIRFGAHTDEPDPQPPRGTRNRV